MMAQSGGIEAQEAQSPTHFSSISDQFFVRYEFGWVLMYGTASLIDGYGLGPMLM
jgi:hypothetical protein